MNNLVSIQIRTDKLFAHLRQKQSNEAMVLKERGNFRSKTLNSQSNYRPKSMYLQRNRTQLTENLKQRQSTLRKTSYHQSDIFKRRSMSAVPNQRVRQNSAKFLYVNKTCMRKVSQFSIGNMSSNHVKELTIPEQKCVQNRMSHIKYVTKGLRVGKKRNRMRYCETNQEENSVRIIGSKIF